MKLLLVTAHKRMSARRLSNIQTRLNLGSDIELTLIMVNAPARRLKAHAVEVVEPSVLPMCPLVPIQGPGLAAWGGSRRFLTRTLRAGRRIWNRLPTPEGLRWSDDRFLLRAAKHSPELAKRAAESDVVVALDAGAVPAVAALGKKVAGPLLVHGARQVRLVLTQNERSLSTPPPLTGSHDQHPDSDPGREESLLPVSTDRDNRLLIAPANYAGQAHLWAQALRTRDPDTWAENLRVGDPRFKSDMTVENTTFRGDLDWRIRWRKKVLADYTHVIVEANLPVLGKIAGRGIAHARELQREGKHVALLSHGSDARIPSVHAQREPWHSYGALSTQQLDAFERTSTANGIDYAQFEGTVFVSTPGLLEFIPAGTWLPLVIEPDRWAGSLRPLREDRPTVAHIPSSTQKGSHMIDPILQAMHDAGEIEYLRVEGIPHDQMPAMYQSADFMVEQFGIADYSVAACEAMAAGCVVVSRVADRVRSHVLEKTGLELPVVEANPETLADVVRTLMTDTSAAEAIRQRSLEFVRTVHDGRLAADVLTRWVHDDNTASSRTGAALPGQ